MEEKLDLIIGAIITFMEENSDLIIGAIITLLTSITTFILTTFSNLKAEERRREWHTEDFKRQQHIETMNKRINDAHDFVNIFLDMKSSYTNAEEALIRNSNLNVIRDTNLELRSLENEIHRKYANIISLNDEELNDLCFEALKILAEEEVIISAWINKSEKTINIDKDKETKRISEFKVKCIVHSSKIIKKLDELSGLYSPPTLDS